MKVIDERSPASQKRLKGLSFEDFLEAFCRVAICKVWPDAATLADSGYKDAWQYMAHLKTNDQEAFAKMIEKRSMSGSDPIIPSIECIYNLIQGSIRVIEEGTNASGAVQLNGRVSVKEARMFKRKWSAW